MPPKRTNGRVALITGANRGIGFEVARQLAHTGYFVVLGSRSPRNGALAARELEKLGLPRVVACPLDVTDAKSVAAAQKFVARRFGRLDVLVNNAGVFIDPSPDAGPAASALRARPEVVRQSFDANALSALRVSQAFMPLMIRAGYGRVVNVSSGMGQLAEMNGFCPGYRLSKAAMNALTRILADETSGKGIAVNSVCPGWVRTRMGGAAADRPVEKGAETIVWLATRPDAKPTGLFFRDKRRIPW